MAEITAQAVKQLRELTDIPMMECKKALVEAGGDQEAAVEILKEQRGKILLKRGDNPTSEGRVFLQIKDDGSEAAMIELQCESPPVAASENFLHVGEQLIKQLLEGPGAQTPEELLSQPAPDHPGTTLNELYMETVGKLRENLVLFRVARVKGPVGGYVHHDGKTGVLFQADGDNANADVLRDVAMHIASMRPAVTTPEDVDPAEVQAERDRLTEEARQTGKPANIISKIVDGRMNNFYKVDQQVLVLQDFVKDDTKTVSQALAEHGLKANKFSLWVLGNA